MHFTLCEYKKPFHEHKEGLTRNKISAVTHNAQNKYIHGLIQNSIRHIICIYYLTKFYVSDSMELLEYEFELKSPRLKPI